MRRYTRTLAGACALVVAGRLAAAGLTLVSPGTTAARAIAAAATRPAATIALTMPRAYTPQRRGSRRSCTT